MSSPTDLETQGLSLRQVWMGLVVFYGLALVLNASSLHQNNQRMPYGSVRSFWVAVTEPLDRLATRQGWDRPRRWMADTLGRPLNE